MSRDTFDQSRVEELVRDHLRSAESSVDSERILAGVRSKMSLSGEGNVRTRLGGPLRVVARWTFAAAAAVLLVGFAWTYRQPSAHADAIKLVNEARQALGSGPIDRAYKVRIELAPGTAERAPFLAALASFDCRLWTRSDRFWIEGRNEARVWAFGRNEAHRVWVAPSREVGLEFAPEEVPEPIDEALDLLSFNLDTVLDMLATDFDVKTVKDTGSRVTRIDGTPKAGHPRPRLRSITVEIDEQTKVVRRVVLSRMRGGVPTGDVSFTFDANEPQSDSSYQLAGHLDSTGAIYGPEQKPRRRRELVRFFGSLLLKSE